MDYRFLVTKELEKFFEGTELSIGEIFYTILSKKLTGVDISNKGQLLEISDQKWYEILERAFEETTDDTPISDEDWDNFINKK